MRIRLLILFFISSSCLAQSFFGADTSNSYQQPTRVQPTAPAPNPVMSADEYKSMVNNLGQQNQESLTQAAKARLDKQAPAITPPTMSNPPAMTNPAISSPPLNPSVPVTMPRPATVQPATIPSSAPPQQPPTSIISPAPSVPANSPQNQPYTGFGNPGNTKPTTNTNPSTGNSNGWNIRY